MNDHIARECLTSRNVGVGTDACNVVDVLDKLADSAARIANSITPLDAAPGRDEDGGYISSLTEAVMSLSSGTRAIAVAMHDIAEAIREFKS